MRNKEMRHKTGDGQSLWEIFLFSNFVSPKLAEWIAHSGKIPSSCSENKLSSKANWPGDENNQIFIWNNWFSKQGTLQKTLIYPCSSGIPEVSRLGLTTEKLETPPVPEHQYVQAHTLPSGIKRSNKQLEPMAMVLPYFYKQWGGFLMSTDSVEMLRPKVMMNVTMTELFSSIEIS